jgi:BirA family biotin operon repressor/biotin-[acetyl-CoA-carboxylase] ligase
MNRVAGDSALHNGAGLWNGSLRLFETLPSTNDYCLANDSALAHGDIILAQRQSSGRGRFGRPWVSIQDKCLTFSVYLDRKKNLCSGPTGMAAAEAVHGVLHNLGIRALLKWPNDLHVSGRKISGILLEAGESGIALGIGLNLGLSAEEIRRAGLASIATSVLIETGRDPGRDGVLDQLKQRLEHSISLVLSGSTPEILDYWRKYDALAGTEISVSSSRGEICGKYQGIDDSGALILIDRKDRKHTVLSGDVTLSA